MIAKTLHDLWRNPARYAASDKERAFMAERSKHIAETHSERFRCLKNVVAHADEVKSQEELRRRGFGG